MRLSPEQRTRTPLELQIPTGLMPHSGKLLPALDENTLWELQLNSWNTIGSIAAFVDSENNIMLLSHNVSEKNATAGALGPLSETGRISNGNIEPKIIEQPLETFHRGIREELGVDDPAQLGLETAENSHWVINQWHQGEDMLGHDFYVCGVSFVVFLPDEAKAALLSSWRETEEISSLHFTPIEDILDGHLDEPLRSGVKPWLKQLNDAQLLTRDSTSRRALDFSSVRRDIDFNSFHDIELG